MFDKAVNHRYTKLGSKPVDPVTEAEMLAIIDEGYAGVEIPLEEYRTPARYKEVVQGYNAHWQQEPFEVLKVQYPFTIPLGDVATRGVKFPSVVHVKLHGIIDLVVRLNEHVIIIDTKTDKYGRDDNWKNSQQMKLYGLAIQEVARLQPESGMPLNVHATLINQVVIRAPYKNEGRAAKANDRPRNEFHRTFPEFIKQEQLEEVGRDTLWWVKTALGWVEDDHFPQNERNCNQLYGKPCGYRDSYCLLPKEQREMALASDTFMDYSRGPLAEKGDLA